MWMVRAVQSGIAWEQVRGSFPGVDPEKVDAAYKGLVLEAAGVSPAPAAPPFPDNDTKKRRRGSA